MKPNACFENSSNWKGPYAKGSLAEKISQGQSPVELAVLQKIGTGEDKAFQVSLSYLYDPPRMKQFEVIIPKINPSEVASTTLPECQTIYYQEVVREKTGENQYKISAKGGSWDSISETCRDNLGLLDFHVKTLALPDSPLGIQIKAQSLANGFWNHMKLEPDDRIVAIDGKANTYNAFDALRADPSWPKKEGLALEVRKLPPPESQPLAP